MENRRRRQAPKQPDLTQMTPVEKEEWWAKERLKIPLAELPLPIRIVNVFEANNVILTRDLMRQTYASLMEMRNFGDKTLAELRSALNTIGIDTSQLWKKPRKPARRRSPR